MSRLRITIQPNGLIAFARAQLIVARDLDLRDAHSQLSVTIGRSESIEMLREVLSESEEDRYRRWQAWLDPLDDDWAPAVERMLGRDRPGICRPTLGQLTQMTSGAPEKGGRWGWRSSVRPDHKEGERDGEEAPSDEDAEEEKPEQESIDVEAASPAEAEARETAQEEEEVMKKEEMKQEPTRRWGGLGLARHHVEHYGLTHATLAPYARKGYAITDAQGRSRRVRRQQLTAEDCEALNTSRRTKWGYRLELLPGEADHGRYLPSIEDEGEAAALEIVDDPQLPDAPTEDAPKDPPALSPVDEAAAALEQLAAREAQLAPAPAAPPVEGEAHPSSGEIAAAMGMIARHEMRCLALGKIVAVLGWLEEEAVRRGQTMDWPDILMDLAEEMAAHA